MSKSLDLNVILAARDKITGPLKKINASTSATAKALKKSRDELKALKASQRDIESFQKMEGALKNSSESLAETQNRVKRLRLELKTTKSPTKQMRDEFNKARKQAEKLTQQTQDQRKKLGGLRKTLKDAGLDTRNLSDEQRRLTEGIKKANVRLERQQKHLDQLGKANIGGKFRNMTREMAGFGRKAGLVAGGASTAIFGIANSTATLGDDVAKAADKIGIGIGAFQELRYAGERSGIATSKLDSSLERYVKRLGEATQGTGAAKKAYETLGLSADQLSKMSPADSLGIVADRLTSVENQSQRVAIAAQLFGREGVAMVNMLKDGSAGLEQLRKDARLTGYVLSEKAARDAEKFKDAMLDAKLGMFGFKNMLGSELMPVVTELMKDLSGWMVENRDRIKAFAKEFGQGLRDAIPILREVVTGVWRAARAIGSATKTMADLVGGFDNLVLVMAGFVAMKPVMAIASFGKSIFTASKAVLGFTGVLPHMKSGLAKGLKGMKSFTGYMLKGTGLLLKGMWALTSGIAKMGLVLLTNPLVLAITAIVGAIGLLAYTIYKNWKTIKTTLSEMWQGFKDLGSQIVDGLVLGFKRKWLDFKKEVVGLGTSAIGWFKDVLGIKSPSKVFKQAGMDTIEGYRQGLKQSENDALKQVNGFGKRVRQVGAGVAIGAAAMPLAAGGITFDNRPPVTSQATAAPVSQGGDIINHFNISGNNPQEIAAEVQRVIMAMERQKAMRAGSALYDRD